MKQNYKEMLIGFVAGQSQGRSKNNDSKLSGFELFKGLWNWVFAALSFGIIFVIVISLFFYEGKVNFLGLSFEGARFYVIAALSIFLIFFIWWKIIFRFQRFFFWGTFIPSVIYLIIWLFIPSLL